MKRKENQDAERKKCSMRMVVYELRNVAGNPFVHIFGLLFPIFLSVFIAKAAVLEEPGMAADMIRMVNTNIFITMAMIIPMAIVLIGYAANYSQEVEKEIPVRMHLFGFQERSLLLAKVIAQFVVLTLMLGIYVAVDALVLDLQMPKPGPALAFIACLYLMGGIFLLLAHSLANLLRKFGPTYCVTMLLYFGFMILCGMMGVKIESLPKACQVIAKMLPMHYVGTDFPGFWQGGSYNFMPLLQSFVFLGAVAGILFLVSLYRARRPVK